MKWILVLMVSTFWGNIERYEVGRFENKQAGEAQASKASQTVFGTSGYKKWLCVEAEK